MYHTLSYLAAHLDTSFDPLINATADYVARKMVAFPKRRAHMAVIRSSRDWRVRGIGENELGTGAHVQGLSISVQGERMRALLKDMVAVPQPPPDTHGDAISDEATVLDEEEAGWICEFQRFVKDPNRAS